MNSWWLTWARACHVIACANGVKVMRLSPFFSLCYWVFHRRAICSLHNSLYINRTGDGWWWGICSRFWKWLALKEDKFLLWQIRITFNSWWHIRFFLFFIACYLHDSWTHTSLLNWWNIYHPSIGHVLSFEFPTLVDSFCLGYFFLFLLGLCCA